VVVLHAASHTFEQMFACAQLMACGVMERHPRLRFAFLESGGGWAPYWIGRLDHQVPSYGGYAPEMRHLPSEYFARQCWISFELDEPTLPLLAPGLGARRVIWGSDYPHADSIFPGALAALRETIAPLDRESRLAILGPNAVDLYALEGKLARS
jgi:predicted TIM-barrel fold metal-dependent hydrolase